MRRHMPPHGITKMPHLGRGKKDWHFSDKQARSAFKKWKHLVTSQVLE